MQNGILTCLECGNSAINKRVVKQGFDLYDVQCQHCEQIGRVDIHAGIKQSKTRCEVKDGQFAYLSENGLDTLRENMENFECVSYDD